MDGGLKLMTVTITGLVTDVTGRPDNTRWHFTTPRAVRQSAAGGIITARPRIVQPLDGEISVDLEPGQAVIEFGDETWTVTIPDTDADLWDVISAAVAFPPNTSQDLLASAVDSYLQENPPSGDIEVDNITDAGTPHCIADVGRQRSPCGPAWAQALHRIPYAAFGQQLLFARSHRHHCDGGMMGAPVSRRRSAWNQ